MPLLLDRLALLGLEGEVLAGRAARVVPSTDSGWKTYGQGRAFLPAITNYIANPRLKDSNADGVPDNWTYSEACAGSPTLSIIDRGGGRYAWRAQYTGQAGDVGATISLTSVLSAIGSFAPGDPLAGRCLLSMAGSGTQAQIYIYTRQADGSTVVDNVAGSACVDPCTLSASVANKAAAAALASCGQVRCFIALIGNGDVVDVTFELPKLSKLATPDVYHDGSTHECAWTGATDASTSTRPASALTYAGLVQIDSTGAPALAGQTIYSRTSGANRGPLVVAAAPYSAGEQAVLTASWHDIMALWRGIKVGDYLMPLGLDSVAYKRVA